MLPCSILANRPYARAHQRWSRLLRAMVIVSVVLPCNARWVAAQAAVAAPPDAIDPPARVGRLAFVDGVVSIRPAAADSWAVATPNRVLTTGDRLWADSTGRAEIEVGSDAIRMSRETELDVVHLDDDMMQLRVPQGTASIRLKTLRAGDVYEVDGPDAAVTFTQAGEYRLDVSSDGDTSHVTVWSGRAEVTAAGKTFDVGANQTGTVIGADTPSYDVATAGAPDEFDRWVLARDARADQATASRRYVSTDIAGTEDLDEYGHWVDEPDYGAVWFPAGMPDGWAPYRFGYWTWVDPWGWNWIDEAPWGWAPFHYGRWAFIGGVWGWWPGPVLVTSVYWRPVYAPCLVTFIDGPAWGLDFFGAGGGIGWFPLGPWEPYAPPYRFGPWYGRRLNGEPDGHPWHGDYRNREVAGGVTTISQHAFASGEPVSRAVVSVPRATLAAGHVGDGGAPVTPTSASLFRAGASERSSAPPARLADRPTVALHAPPPTVRFSAEQRQLSANGGRPLSTSERTALRATVPLEPEMAHTRSAAVPVRGGAALTPRRAGLPAARPALGTPATARRVSVGQSPGEASYEAERSQMESRHINEFAAPPRGESPQALYNRQESERRALQSRYQGSRPAPRASAPPAGGGRRK
jgi:hypothetical protein